MKMRLRLSFKTSKTPPASSLKQSSSPAVLCASDVQAHADAAYQHAQVVKHNKTSSEETALALLKLTNAVHASALQYGENSDVAQYALGRVSQTLEMLDAALADTEKRYSKQRTVESRLAALQALISLLKIELKITLGERRCGLIERDAHAAAPGTSKLTHY